MEGAVNSLLVQIALGFFALMLTIITGLMAFMTKAVINASVKVALLEQSFKTADGALASMAGDVRELAKNNATIQVLQSELTNIKQDVEVLFRNLREIKET